MRIRRNAALLSPDEWRRYCRAIVTLKHTFPAGSAVSIYDQFVAMHIGVWGLTFAKTEEHPNGATGPAAGVDGAHRGPAFLPWHREYLRRYEEALAAVDPTVSLPYWNWGLGGNSETTDLFHDDRMGPRGGTVTSGYFAEGRTSQNPSGWSIHADLRPHESALSRDGTDGVGSLPSKARVLSALEQAEYSSFRPAVEAVHDSAHGWVGGDMAEMSSPNDPIFFMHHAQVDRLWAIWQRTHPGVENYNDSNLDVGQGHGPADDMWPWDGGASTPGAHTRENADLDPAAARELLPTLPVFDRVTPTDVLDTRELGYIYDGEDARWEAGKTDKSVDHNWSTVHIPSRYGRNMVVVACLDSFVGPDTAAVRVRSRAGDPNVDFMLKRNSPATPKSSTRKKPSDISSERRASSTTTPARSSLAR